MKKGKTSRNLLAVMLGIAVAFSACACASIDAPQETSGADESCNDTSALELSEVNAEITASETETLDTETSDTETSGSDDELSADSEATLSEDVTVTPITPTYPEERETTLELVKEYPLGEGGIPFDIFVGENSAYKTIDLPGWYCADERGDVYAFTGTAFYDLQSGEKLDISFDGLLISQVMALDGKLYGWSSDGTMNIYTIQDGKTGTVKYPERSRNGTRSLFVSPDGTPRVVVDGVFYDESGEKIAKDYALDTVQKGEDTLNLLGKTYLYTEDLYVQCYANGILTAYEMQRHENKLSLPDQQTGIETLYEYAVYQYDKNGNPLSELMIYRYSDPRSIPCSISYAGVECTNYKPITYTVGNRIFENLLDGEWFVGADGTIYLLVISPEGGELYKVNPGYSDVKFTDYEADAEIQQTAAAASATVKHANISADVAETRANEMINLCWTVQAENRYIRSGGALPHYLAIDDYNAAQTGIPYCWGGFNGLDTEGSGYKKNKVCGCDYTSCERRETLYGGEHK